MLELKRLCRRERRESGISASGSGSALAPCSRHSLFAGREFGSASAAAERVGGVS